MTDLFDILKNAGAPLAAIVVQAVLTWYKVKDHSLRITRLEGSIYGDDHKDGLAARLRILEHDADRSD